MRLHSKKNIFRVTRARGSGSVGPLVIYHRDYIVATIKRRRIDMNFCMSPRDDEILGSLRKKIVFGSRGPAGRVRSGR